MYSIFTCCMALIPQRQRQRSCVRSWRTSRNEKVLYLLNALTGVRGEINRLLQRGEPPMRVDVVRWRCCVAVRHRSASLRPTAAPYSSESSHTPGADSWSPASVHEEAVNTKSSVSWTAKSIDERFSTLFTLFGTDTPLAMQ